MEELYKETNGIKLKRRSDGYYDLRIINKSDLKAELFFIELDNINHISYSYESPDTFLILTVYLMNRECFFNIPLPINEETKYMMYFIDNKTITGLGASYLDHLKNPFEWKQVYPVTY